MVLRAYGTTVTERELREQCQCDADGTSMLRLVEAAKYHGFSNTFRSWMTIEELQMELQRGLFPIVYLKVKNGGISYTHSVVVMRFGRDNVEFLDPDQYAGGERVLAREAFEQLWRETNGLTVIVE